MRAAAWASNDANREAVFALWEKSGTPAAVFRADYDGQRLAERLSPLVDDLLIDTYREKAARARDLGLVRRAVDVTGWFEPTYVDAAIRDLGLPAPGPATAPTAGPWAPDTTATTGARPMIRFTRRALAAVTLALASRRRRRAEPVTIRFGFASIGTDNRPSPVAAPRRSPIPSAMSRKP